MMAKEWEVEGGGGGVPEERENHSHPILGTNFAQNTRGSRGMHDHCRTREESSHACCLVYTDAIKAHNRRWRGC